MREIASSSLSVVNALFGDHLSVPIGSGAAFDGMI